MGLLSALIHCAPRFAVQDLVAIRKAKLTDQLLDQSVWQTHCGLQIPPAPALLAPFVFVLPPQSV
jgi:hypothetical protein